MADEGEICDGFAQAGRKDRRTGPRQQPEHESAVERASERAHGTQGKIKGNGEMKGGRGSHSVGPAQRRLRRNALRRHSSGARKRAAILGYKPPSSSCGPLLSLSFSLFLSRSLYVGGDSHHRALAYVHAWHAHANAGRFSTRRAVSPLRKEATGAPLTRTAPRRSAILHGAPLRAMMRRRRARHKRQRGKERREREEGEGESERRLT